MTATTPEELRQKLMQGIDVLLAHTLMIRGEDRALLTALRGYAGGMTDADLERLMTYFANQ